MPSTADHACGAVLALAHARPLLVDHGPHVHTDRGPDVVTLRLRKRPAVPDDGGQCVRLVAHVALRVGEVLVRDHDHEREQQAEQRRDDAEHLRRDLRVEALADPRHEPPNQPDEPQHEADDRRDDQEQQKPDRHVIDDTAEHDRNLRRQTPVWAATRPEATASCSAR